jgi:hypothetical protein
VPNNHMACPYRLPAFAVFNAAGEWLFSCRGPEAFGLAVQLVRRLNETRGVGFFYRQLPSR